MPHVSVTVCTYVCTGLSPWLNMVCTGLTPAWPGFNSHVHRIICLRTDNVHALRLMTQTGTRVQWCPLWPVITAASKVMILRRYRSCCCSCCSSSSCYSYYYYYYFIIITIIITCIVWGHHVHDTVCVACWRHHVSLLHISLHCSLHQLYYYTHQFTWNLNVTLQCNRKTLSHTHTHTHTHTRTSPRLIDWVRLNVPPTHYRSYGDGFLRVKWPNQQCQSTERTHTKQNEIQQNTKIHLN